MARVCCPHCGKGFVGGTEDHLHARAVCLPKVKEPMLTPDAEIELLQERVAELEQSLWALERDIDAKDLLIEQLRNEVLLLRKWASRL